MQEEKFDYIKWVLTFMVLAPIIVPLIVDLVAKWFPIEPLF
jgi:hypothetical protein